jgi:hypothetical protein
LDLIDYGDEAIVKSEHLRPSPIVYFTYPPLADRRTLDVSEFTEREIPKELLVDFFKERHPNRAMYMGTRNERVLVRLSHCDDTFLGENLEPSLAPFSFKKLTKTTTKKRNCWKKFKDLPSSQMLVITILEQNIDDYQTFCGSPLYCKMLAETFENATE